MTNDELAKAIERGLDGSDYVSFVLCDAEWQQIIAALRRGPEREVCQRCKGSGEAKWTDAAIQAEKK